MDMFIYKNQGVKHSLRHDPTLQLVPDSPVTRYKKSKQDKGLKLSSADRQRPEEGETCSIVKKVEKTD